MSVGYIYDNRDDENGFEIINVVITSTDGIVISDEMNLMVKDNRIYVWLGSTGAGVGVQYKYREIPQDVEWRLYEAMIFDGIIEPEVTDDLERN